MEQFLGRYRGYRIFSIEELGEFRVEGLTPRFLTFTKAQLTRHIGQLPRPEGRGLELKGARPD